MTVAPGFASIFPGQRVFAQSAGTNGLSTSKRHHLAFAFDEEVQDRAYEIWQARGGGHGHDRDDWFEAEHQLGKVAEEPECAIPIDQKRETKTRGDAPALLSNEDLTP